MKPSEPLLVRVVPLRYELAHGPEQGREFCGNDGEDLTRAFFRFLYAERGLLRLRMTTMATRGQLHPRRHRDYMEPFMDEGVKALARFVEVEAIDLRLSIQAITFVMVRFALMSDAQVAFATNGSAESARQLVEDHVVRTARRMVCPDSHG